MNIVQVVLKEHSKAMCDRIVRYVGGDPSRFEELVNVFLGGPYRVTQRASWPLSHCVEKHPELIKPHLKGIIKNLDSPGIHDSVKRNTIRLLQFIDIPTSFQGIIANICFGYLLDPKETVAVRVFSMSVLAGIADNKPDLAKELRIIIEDQLPYGSPGYISRGRAILKQLKN